MGELEKNIDKILENKYKDSLKILRMSKTSQELLEELKKECPKSTEKEIISLFKSVAAGTKMVDSAIIAAAHNIEYNINHPPKPEKTWFDDLFTTEARKIMTPKELMKNKNLYKEFIDYISNLEEKYDLIDVPDNAIFRRRATIFLRARMADPKKKRIKQSLKSKIHKKHTDKIKNDRKTKRTKITTSIKSTKKIKKKKAR
jgi:hypothetical protein